nr:RHS repeat-associated core domain-containing protein [Methylosinus sp. KRF6]
MTNVGYSNLHFGYYSRALDAWRRAWVSGRDATEPRAKALTDGAVGQLIRLYAALGKIDDVSALFKDIGERPITGSATEAVQTARDIVRLSEKDPRHLFNCGPTALKALLTSLGATPEQVDFLQWYRAPPGGTSLEEVGQLADKAKFPFKLIFRKPGEAIPKTAVVHWKVGHFAAIVGESAGRLTVVDPIFPGRSVRMTKAALDAEASGYYLVPANTAIDEWRSVDNREASYIWGKGPTTGVMPGDAGDPDANPNGCPEGMCRYNIKESAVSLTLSDTPLGYSPPVGPSPRTIISYNQRDTSLPATFNFFNVGPKWSLNWLTYIHDDPTDPGANVSRYNGGGEEYYYTGYSGNTGQFTAETVEGSILTLESQNPIRYRRLRPDGSAQIYASPQSGQFSFSRRVFLSQVIDPQGNALTLDYDGQMRLLSVTDAAGRQTTFSYNPLGWPFLVTGITDPFGRTAKLNYDSYDRLVSITDVIGLTSSVTYDSEWYINSLTTPYGVTNFSFTSAATAGPPRFLQITDPLGYSEREEWLEPAPIPGSEPTSAIPQGMPVTPTNQYLEYRNSFHWDKNQYVSAGCTPTGGCDYTKARVRHFTHVPNSSLKSTTIDSVKEPLENRVWFSYPGQSSSVFSGSYNKPIAIGRVLDDGSTQLTQFSYDASSFFNLTQQIDPIGRVTQFSYAANGIDLLSIAQSTAKGVLTPIAQFTYNDKHRPLVYTDAAGQSTFYTYNAAGQPTSATNALRETTSYQYDTTGNLTTIINANGATAASFTYDGYARVRTYTDSEGWTATYDYDAADRVTKITYPDGTADLYVYDKLDLASFQDREGRLWIYTHDANRRLTKIVDPLGEQTLFGYNGAGALTSLTDAKGNVTSWTYDVRGRLASKQYADSSMVSYSYETTTSRLKSVTDALGQIKQYAYANDNRLTGVAYSNAVNPTPNVAFSYDPYLPRVASMTDGNGATRYSYAGSFSFGALRLQQECFVPTGASSCAYQIDFAYDALGRRSSRTVSGFGAETFQYDAIGRLTGHASDLGSFALSYLGQTDQITQRSLLPLGSTLSTSWSYLPNSGDRRLAAINNVGLSASQFSNFQFTTTPENFITSITETSDAAPVYPSVMSQTASYNNLNQLTNLSGQSLSYDANGNLLSDGQRNYSWDAESRLVGIAYPGQPGKATAFAYDGFGRRTTIASTPAGGGSAVATGYVWCGTQICQARNASNSPTRGYYDEGEFVPGSPALTYYYGVDQIGSVRRVFTSAINAPTYSFDPYGNALQVTLPLANFGYAGMLYNADSELSLTHFRAYNSTVGRWLSRDPIGEAGATGWNLYTYAGNSPVVYVDPDGLQEILLGRIPPWLGELVRSGRIGRAELDLPKEPVPGRSGKEGATDVPSWCRGQRPRIGESGSDFAKRLMDDEYGPGNWEKGTGYEYNKIQKWGDRSFRIPKWFLDRYRT